MRGEIYVAFSLLGIFSPLRSTMHVQLHHRSATEAMQRPKDKEY